MTPGLALFYDIADKITTNMRSYQFNNTGRAFYDTPLDTILRQMGKDTVIICGTLTNCCCGTTARQAYERSYYVIFGSDITSTYDCEMQKAELDILRFAFARVMTAEEIMSM